MNYFTAVKKVESFSQTSTELVARAFMRLLEFSVLVIKKIFLTGTLESIIFLTA